MLDPCQRSCTLHCADTPMLVARPNILFLMSDEHRPDVAGFAGNPVVRTPFLDSLAAEGVVFDNCYAASPVCVPGRQAMMAGRHCHSCGVRGYWDDLPPFSMTFARRLAQYGYQTVCCGKLHHHGADQMQGWTARPVSDTAVDWRYIDGFVKPDPPAAPAEDGAGKWSMAKEVQRAGIGRGPYQSLDELSVQGALRFIEEYFNSPFYDRPGGHQPLLLKVSLVQPHYPFFTDAQRFNYYLNRVPVFRAPVRAVPLCPKEAQPAVEVSPREARRATAAYYGMVETIDAYYRQVADALHAVGQNLDQWIVLYTSDHGEMLGEHGLWKKNCFCEASVRVPLIVRWPAGLGRTPRRIDHNVNLIDLFATLCDLGGVPVPPGLDSRSLAPLLRGQDASWDNETLSCDRGSWVMIKRDHLKYQNNGPGLPDVLFDLRADPGETTNRIDEPAYAAAAAAFRRRLAELGWQAKAAAGPTDPRRR